MVWDRSQILAVARLIKFKLERLKQMYFRAEQTGFQPSSDGLMFCHLLLQLLNMSHKPSLAGKWYLIPGGWTFDMLAFTHRPPRFVYAKARSDTQMYAHTTKTCLGNFHVVSGVCLAPCKALKPGGENKVAWPTWTSTQSTVQMANNTTIRGVCGWHCKVTSKQCRWDIFSFFPSQNRTRSFMASKDCS